MEALELVTMPPSGFALIPTASLEVPRTESQFSFFKGEGQALPTSRRVASGEREGGKKSWFVLT